MARIKYGKHFKNEITVNDLEDKPEFIFTNVDYEVIDLIGESAFDEYQSVFVLYGNADYKVIYGMHGIVPYLNKALTKLYEA